MDPLSFLKLLWRPTPTPIPIPIPTSPATNDTPSSFADTDDEDADSFFELDVALSDVDAKSCDSPKVPIHVDDDSVVLKFHESTSSTPASPISILRSSPSFRGRMFRKPRAVVEEQEAGDGNRWTKKSARLFAVRLRGKEFAAGGDDGPKRNNAEPKDGFMKYMKKPFRVSYVGGASRRNDDTGGFAVASSRLSPSSSPALQPKKGRPESGIRVRYKNMGKSKSGGETVNGRERTNDSMAEQQEGINGAILHCKKSYYYPSQ